MTTLIGKILIVAIFVMSLVFMSFAVAVYATHQNWRAVAERKPEDVKPGEAPGLKYQIQEARKENTERKEEHEKLRLAIQLELEQKKDQLAKLEAHQQVLEKAAEEAHSEIEELKKTYEQQVAALTGEETDLKTLSAAVDVLRKNIRAAQAERDKTFKAIVSLTDEIVAAQGQLSILKERAAQLTDNVAAQKKVLESTVGHF
jgi:chromosome segregation ATPase